MTPIRGPQNRVMRRVMLAWQSAWPCCALLAFAGLAAVRSIPAGYARAVVAVPVLLLVPGTLTLGAIFGVRRRPRGTAFICLAALLGVAWTAFALLVLYLLGVLIAARSTYLCLLAASAALAILAQGRIVIERRAANRQAPGRSGPADPDSPDAQADTGQTSAQGSWYYAIAAIMGGLSLLAGGAYAVDHFSRSAPVGYTWIAWSGPQVTGVLNISPAGNTLPFQIVHQQPDTTAFTLAADWLGTPSRPMAGPLDLTIGPDQTFHGDLFIPPLKNGCTYRIVVTLTAAQPTANLAQEPQTWSINADVRDPAKSAKTCPSP